MSGVRRPRAPEELPKPDRPTGLPGLATAALRRRRRSGAGWLCRPLRSVGGVLGRLVVARIVQRPAFGGQPLAHPFDVLGSRQLIGDLGDQYPDVDAVEFAAVDAAVDEVPGDGLDL